ncbi:D-serine ammonia-lyase [Salinibacillus xinjiangensis]|uniref:Probable D-serine dehydratase n=1 Tax=Salinibacillus xinjiangensis TaxID=1229268 RepID=A0A6G1X5D2_9BACI|nr:D-serine ammonia-lyase [Salinibacillus xinjiangensis]MRG86147.1 D-serine ammonia-lyase [Salinibacillus xinjiangensis]
MSLLVFSSTEIQKWQEKHPLLKKILQHEPVFWQNPNEISEYKLSQLPVVKSEMLAAAQLWERFAPYFAAEFPETIEGVIESSLKNIPNMKKMLEKEYSSSIDGELLLKCDHQLPIAGSIKARGGVYEVLHFAETLALKTGLIDFHDDYQAFSNPAFKQLFQKYTIGVGSTGNLGLSIGIMSAKLGFNVNVYMSKDAKQWKKDLLRSKGANVLEFKGDFSKAVDEGRRRTHADPDGYFIDDEDSKHLFLGYSVAALRLKDQLADKNIKVDRNHPLFVYLPCGVGGAPGGISFGLKQVFGDNVHCFFVEPTHSPSVLIGLVTGEMDRVSVQDFRVDNQTEADGLAVGRPSKFATEISDKLVSGIYTIEDDELFRLLALLADQEGHYVEPSATAGLLGPVMIQQSNYDKRHKIHPQHVTHISWATGGSLVPDKDMNVFYQKGKNN